MNEDNEDRIKILVTLAKLDEPSESVPINKLIRIPGTPLDEQEEVDPFAFIKTIALAPILMPQSYIRLSAGDSRCPMKWKLYAF
jgi:biotin synthase